MELTAPIPRNDPRRLSALRSLYLGGNAPDHFFDALAGTAAAVCRTPIALVVLVDEFRQWFIGSVGMPDIRSLSGQCTFSTHLVATGQPLVVPNASLDARFAAHDLVTGPYNMQFYAGAPIAFGSGVTLGSICVVDHVPRKLARHQMRALHDLAGIATRTLASRAAVLLPIEERPVLQTAHGPMRRARRVTEDPFDLPDPDCLAVRDRAETLLWADDLSITTARLHEIVAKVGPMRAAVRAYVKAQRRAAAQVGQGPHDED